jgi:hypothetical protein
MITFKAGFSSARELTDALMKFPDGKLAIDVGTALMPLDVMYYVNDNTWLVTCCEDDEEMMEHDDVVHVWYISPFGSLVDQPFTVIEFCEDDEMYLMLGCHEQVRANVAELVKNTGAELIETVGVAGLADTDPYWNREETFQCGNCETIHNAHETVAEMLYLRAVKKER